MENLEGVWMMPNNVLWAGAGEAAMELHSISRENEFMSINPQSVKLQGLLGRDAGKMLRVWEIIPLKLSRSKNSGKSLRPSVKT